MIDGLIFGIEKELNSVTAIATGGYSSAVIDILKDHLTILIRI